MADNETSYLPIDTCLEQIEQAVYGREVRKAIHDGIAQCYTDSTANAQKADIEAKGAEVLASIPDTYEDLQNDVNDVESAIVHGGVYGTTNLLFPLNQLAEQTSLGITYGWNNNKTILTVSGSISEGYNNYSAMLFVKQPLPLGLETGKTYHVKYASVNVPLYIYSHNASRSAVRIFNSKTSGDFTIPDDTEEMDVRFYFASGIQFNEEIKVPIVYDDYANIKLIDDIEKLSEDYQNADEELERSFKNADAVLETNINRNWPTLLYTKNKLPVFEYDGNDLIVSIGSPIRVDNIGTMSSSGDVSGSYRISRLQHLVYNMSAKALFVRNNSSEFLNDDVELISLTNGSAVIGQWAPYYYIQTQIASVRNDLDTMLVPDYYNTNNYLAGRINAVNSIANTLSNNSARMFFITDYHHGSNSNANNSPKLINKIISDTGIRNIVFGGDAYDKENSPNKAQNKFFEFLEMFRPLEKRANVFYTTGNHEYNNPAADPLLNENMLTMRTIYEMYMGHTPPKVTRITDTNAFYYDDDVSKIRIYCLDCDYGSSITMNLRKNMLATLSEVPEGFAVLVFSHTGTSTTTPPAIINRMNQICQVCAAMNDGVSTTVEYTSSDHVTYDFTGKARTFIGVISGHTHKDGYVYYDNRFPVISTTCDAYGKQSSHPERVPGTILEQAFDVVQVDVTAKRIYLTRIGWGEDRVFSFGEVGSGIIST